MSLWKLRARFVEVVQRLPGAVHGLLILHAIMQEARRRRRERRGQR